MKNELSPGGCRVDVLGEGFKTNVFDTSAEFAPCCASAIDLTDEEYLKELESVPSY
jgi:hypothetical protein